jgi:hypothetical protein
MGFWIVELRWPHYVAVELVDGGSPSVWADHIRVACQRRAPRSWTGLPGRREYVLRRPWRIHRRIGRRGALEPRVGFRPPATGNLIGTESLPDDTADIRVVDRIAEGGLEERQGNGTRVVPRGQPDGLGDKSTIPD